MREELKEIYEQYLVLSDEDRINEARIAASSTLEALNKEYPDNPNNARLLMLVIRMCINMDNKVSVEECNLFNNLFNTNFSFEQFEEMILYKDKGEFDHLDAITDRLPEEIKLDLCLLGLVFLSADGLLTEEEVEKFEELLA